MQQMPSVLSPWCLGPLIISGFIEDPLEEEMATHSCILAWKILWTEEPGKLHGVAKELDTTEQLSARIRACRHLPLSYSIPKMVAISGSRKGGTVQS